MTLTTAAMIATPDPGAPTAPLPVGPAWNERDATEQIEIESALSQVASGFLRFHDLWLSSKDPMKPKDIAAFNDSLSRCLSSTNFLDDFYLRFLQSSPIVAAKFKDTDFDKQKCLLRTSLYMMVMAVEGEDEALEYLDEIAKRHDRNGLDVSVEFYILWLDCLVASARDNDTDFTDDTERVWRSMMQFGIDRMLAQY